MTPMPSSTEAVDRRSTVQHVGREITLLPRHWEWLAAQPRSASATLRRLVDDARRDPDGRVRIEQAKEACYRYLRHNAGDRIGFEDAVRALYAGEASRFCDLSAAWPTDVREHARTLAAAAMDIGSR